MQTGGWGKAWRTERRRNGREGNLAPEVRRSNLRATLWPEMHLMGRSMEECLQRMGVWNGLNRVNSSKSIDCKSFIFILLKLIISTIILPFSTFPEQPNWPETGNWNTGTAYLSHQPQWRSFVAHARSSPSIIVAVPQFKATPSTPSISIPSISQPFPPLIPSHQAPTSH